MRKTTFGFALIVAVGVSLLAAASCSNYGEGERCNVHSGQSGNDDCQSGLVCVPQSDLNGANSDLCCPANRDQASAAACQRPRASLTGDAAPPADRDANASETSTTDAVAQDANVSDAADANASNANDAGDARAD